MREIYPKHNFEQYVIEWGPLPQLLCVRGPNDRAEDAGGVEDGGQATGDAVAHGAVLHDVGGGARVGLWRPRLSLQVDSALQLRTTLRCHARGHELVSAASVII